MPYTSRPGERRCSEASPLVNATAKLPAGHCCCPLLSLLHVPDVPQGRRWVISHFRAVPRVLTRPDISRSIYWGPWPLTHRQPSRPVPDGVGESREHPGPRVTRREATARCTAQLSRRKGTLGTGMTCAGRVAAVRSWLAARPALPPH